MLTPVFVCAVSLAGGALGWTLVPWAADVFLRRAYERSVSWWWDSFRAYLQIKRLSPEKELSPAASGEEGAIALWLEDAVRSARSGHLTHERAQALEDEGLGVCADNASRTELEQKERCSFTATIWQRAACALALALTGAVLVGMDVAVLPACALGACALFLSIAVVCDLCARMIPLECCGGIAVAGVVFQVAAVGMGGLVPGMVCGAVVVVGCLVVNRWCGRAGAVPVGHGDVRCMAALSLVTGAAAPVGLAACYASAALFSLAGLVLKKLTLRDGIPMAPFLAVWLICGVGVVLYR